MVPLSFRRTASGPPTVTESPTRPPPPPLKLYGEKRLSDEHDISPLSLDSPIAPTARRVSISVSPPESPQSSPDSKVVTHPKRRSSFIQAVGNVGQTVGKMVSAIRAASPSFPFSTKDSVRRSFTHVMSSPNTSFHERSKEMLVLCRRYAPDKTQELEAFAKKNPAITDKLTASGYKVAVANVKLFETPTLTDIGEFRETATQLAIEVCQETLRQRGWDPPGEIVASGTKSYKSDKDFEYYAPPGMSQKEQMAVKLQMDLILRGIFGEECDKFFDVVFYACPAKNTESAMKTNPGLEGYARVEFAAASLQMLQQCRDALKKEGSYGEDGLLDLTKSKEWQQYKEEMKDLFPDHAKSIESSFKDLENYQAQVEKGILAQLENDHGKAGVQKLKANKGEYEKAYKEAEIAYRMRALVNISEKIDKCEEAIEKLEAHVTEEETKLQAGVSACAYDLDPPQRKKDHEKLDSLRNELASLYLLRAVKGGYNTQAAYFNICSNAQGQIHRSQIEDLQDRLKSERFVDFHLKAAQKIVTTPLQYAHSALENWTQHTNHFNADLRAGAGAGDALIDSSKYTERTLQANEKLLLQMAKAKGAKDDDLAEVVRIQHANRALLQKAAELEKAKRKFSLNNAATKALLKEAIIDDLANRKPPVTLSQAKLEELDKDIDELVNMSEPGGKLADVKFEESLRAQDKFPLLQAKLIEDKKKQKGYITQKRPEPEKEAKEFFAEHHGFPPSHSPTVDAILRARVGLPKDLLEKDPEVQNIFKKNIDEITLSALGLDVHEDEIEVPENIRKFNEDIKRLTFDTYRLAQKMGVIPPPNGNMPSLTTLWSSALGE